MVLPTTIYSGNPIDTAAFETTNYIDWDRVHIFIE